MPKKRFTTQYSKPASTVHPSLSSGGASSSNKRNDAPPSVNELIASIRKSNISTPSAAPSTVVTPTLPPQIRHLLSQPETPTPKPRARDRRRRDIHGRLLPDGPAPPKSWLQSSRHAPVLRSRDKKERVFPHDVHHLPGLHNDGGGRRLQDMCLRTMAREWEFVRSYEKHNLVDLPSGLRGLLLSNIAIYGPEEGVGGEGLDSLLLLPDEEERKDNNDGLYRLDLSGSVGRSVSFKHLIELLQKPTTPPPSEDVEISWEENIYRSINAPIPHLTHLSISHPPPNISWPRFLNMAKHLPTLTHLSLAFWPVPSLTPNAKTAVMSSKTGNIQYSGTNYYSHSLDDDWREAAMVLKTLANRVYGLEYLDLEGCIDWLQALRWSADDAGIDWSVQWVGMRTIQAFSGYVLREESEFWEVEKFTKDVLSARLLQKHVVKQVGKGRWVEVEKDDSRLYEGLWKGNGEEERKKSKALDGLKTLSNVQSSFSQHRSLAETATEEDLIMAERRSIWDQ